MSRCFVLFRYMPDLTDSSERQVAVTMLSLEQTSPDCIIVSSGDEIVGRVVLSAEGEIQVQSGQSTMTIGLANFRSATGQLLPRNEEQVRDRMEEKQPLRRIADRLVRNDMSLTLERIGDEQYGVRLAGAGSSSFHEEPLSFVEAQQLFRDTAIRMDMVSLPLSEPAMPVPQSILLQHEAGRSEDKDTLTLQYADNSVSVVRIVGRREQRPGLAEFTQSDLLPALQRKGLLIRQ